MAADSVFRKLIEAFEEQDQKNCAHTFHPMYSYCLKCRKKREEYSDVVAEGSFEGWTIRVHDWLPPRTLMVSQDVWDQLRKHTEKEEYSAPRWSNPHPFEEDPYGHGY